MTWLYQRAVLSWPRVWLFVLLCLAALCPPLPYRGDQLTCSPTASYTGSFYTLAIPSQSTRALPDESTRSRSLSDATAVTEPEEEENEFNTLDPAADLEELANGFLRLQEEAKEDEDEDDEDDDEETDEDVEDADDEVDKETVTPPPPPPPQETKDVPSRETSSPSPPKITAEEIQVGYSGPVHEAAEDASVDQACASIKNVVAFLPDSLDNFLLPPFVNCTLPNVHEEGLFCQPKYPRTLIANLASPQTTCFEASSFLTPEVQHHLKLKDPPQRIIPVRRIVDDGTSRRVLIDFRHNPHYNPHAGDAETLGGVGEEKSTLPATRGNKVDGKTAKKKPMQQARISTVDNPDAIHFGTRKGRIILGCAIAGGALLLLGGSLALLWRFYARQGRPLRWRFRNKKAPSIDQEEDPAARPTYLNGSKSVPNIGSAMPYTQQGRRNSRTRVSINLPPDARDSGADYLVKPVSLPPSPSLHSHLSPPAPPTASLHSLAKATKTVTAPQLKWTEWTANHAYEPSFQDELAVLPGDTLFVIRIFDDGWGHALNVRTDQDGLVPLSFCRPEHEVEVDDLDSVMLMDVESLPSVCLKDVRRKVPPASALRMERNEQLLSEQRRPSTSTTVNG